MNDSTDNMEMDIDSTFQVPIWSQHNYDDNNMEAFDLLSETQKNLFTQDDTFRINDEFMKFFDQDEKEDVLDEFSAYFNEDVSENNILNEAILEDLEQSEAVIESIQEDNTRITNQETSDTENHSESVSRAIVEENINVDEHSENMIEEEEINMENCQTPATSNTRTCKYCSQTYIYHKAHIKGNSKCLELYLKEFNLHPENWEDEHRRQRVRMQASRQHLARRSETERRASRLYSPENFIHTVNEKMISHGKKYICFLCDNMLSIENTTFVDNSSSNEDRHKYASGYAVCQSCISGIPIQRNFQTEETIFFKTIEENGTKINVPQTDINTDTEVEGGQNILLPINGSVLHRYPDLSNFTFDKEMNVNICPGKIQLQNLPSAAYKNQLIKIADSFKNSEIFFGNIINEETNAIRITKNIPALDKIKGTDDHRLKYVEDLKNTFFYCGQIFFKVDLEINVPSKASFLYMLLHRNENKLETSEMNKWIVHSNHNTSKSCNDSCIPLNLDDLYKSYDKELFTSGVYLHTQAQYLNDYFHVLSDSLKKMFGCLNFSSFLHFEDQGKVTLRGVFWPNEFDDLNSKLSNNQELSAEEKMKILEYVEKILCTTTDEKYLEEFFDLSASKAKEIAESAKKVQTTDKFYFPSNLNIIKDNNSQHSRIFRELKKQFRSLLESMDPETKTLDEFFHRLEQHETYEIQEDEHFVRLKLPNQNVIKLPRIDQYENLKEAGLSKLASLYHAAIAVKSSSGIEIILRRRPCDSRIASFCPQLMLDSHQDISLIGSSHQSVLNQLVMNEKIIPEEFSQDHGVFSGIEAIFLLDPKKSFICRGNVSVAVSTSENRARVFKKADNPNEISYTDISSGKKFLLLEDSYSKYLTRKDNPSLCFAEFLSVYDVKNRDEKVSSNSGSQELSNKHLSTCCENQSLLPKEIITSSGMKLRIRRSRRPILIRSNADLFSDEQKLSDVKLYIAHTSESYILENFKNLYSMRCCEKFDGHIPLTKIQVIQKKVFPNYDKNFGVKFLNE